MHLSLSSSQTKAVILVQLIIMSSDHLYLHLGTVIRRLFTNSYYRRQLKNYRLYSQVKGYSNALGIKCILIERYLVR